MKKFLQKIKSYKTAKKFISPIYCLLANGIYYYRHRCVNKINYKNLHNLLFLHSLFIVNSKTKYKKITNGQISFGSQKICLFSDGYVYCAFNHPNFYLRTKKNIDKFLSGFNYPCSPINEFNDEFKIYTTKEIFGQKPKTNDDINQTIKKILECNLCSKGTLLKNNKLYIIQHGDTNPSNIFLNGNDIYFIDIGGIEYRTALFDFFYTIIFPSNLRNITFFVKKYKNQIKEIFIKNKIKFVNSTIDEYLSYFVDFYLNVPTGKVDFLYKMFLDEECIKYPKTYKLLKAKL